MEPAPLLRGQCQCGAVHYQVKDSFEYALNCHCSQCRKTSGHYAAYSPAATDGTEVAVGILHAALPASADVRNGVAFVRLAEVAAARLTGLDAAAIADFKTRHLIVR